MTHIYIASTFANRERLRPIRDELQRRGHQVHSRWLDEPDDPPSSHAAHISLDDVRKADLLILDTNEHGTKPSQGGRYVELGYTLGLGRHAIWLIGPRTNVFTYLPRIRHFETWEEALAAL